jgi:hypothetical protein
MEEAEIDQKQNRDVTLAAELKGPSVWCWPWPLLF